MARRLSRGRAMLAGVLVIGLLAGCASDPRSATDSSEPADAPHARGLLLSGPRVPTVASAPAGTVSRAWEMDASRITSTSTRIYLVVDSSPCVPAGRTYTLTTTSTTITIGFWTRPQRAGVICTPTQVVTFGYIQLDAPIGDRTIAQVPVGTSAPRH